MNGFSKEELLQMYNNNESEKNQLDVQATNTVQNNENCDADKLEHANVFINHNESVYSDTEFFYTTDQFILPVVDEGIYVNEIIKQDGSKGHKRGRGLFGKIVAAVLITSMVGGVSLGFGIGAGISAVNNRTASNQDSASDSNSGVATNNLASLDDSIESTPSTGTYFIANNNSTESFLPSSFADLAEYIMPSVVSINSTFMVSTRFFTQDYESAGSGSGIIFYEDSEKVYVVTNNHVISGAVAVSVSINEKEEVTARLVDSDIEKDIAVISVLKSDLLSVGVKSVKLAVFGDSESMRVGDWVMAVGNAMGEGITVTSGLVSAKDKEIIIDNITLIVTQTDAAINPGNSGGPLINLNGEVIGINTAKMSESNVEGMGYCIPSNILKPIVDRLMSRLTKPMLGISGRDLDEATASSYGIELKGVLIASVQPGYSAEKAGLQANDIILSYNGKTVNTMSDLQSMIQSSKIGDKVELGVLRNGKDRITLYAILMEYSDIEF